MSTGAPGQKRRRMPAVKLLYPSRDRLIFIATDLSMPLIDVIRLYGLCLKIELSFEQALRVLSFPEG